ncbi:MAG: sec-independent protein translocase protein TatA [Acidobacteriota bacterium]|nr:sec-independent protein translocase protein TatA [Acidobacteriota bacterium]
MTLLFLESVGTTELLVILIAALVLFGPRKLPELSRSLGKGLSEFKRASDEFKQTWEREVSFETSERERRVGDAMLPPENQRAEINASNMIASSSVAPEAQTGANTIARGAGDHTGEPTMFAPVDSTTIGTNGTDASARRDTTEIAPQSPHKADWL